MAIGERCQLELKDEKENTPMVDMVAIVAEVYGAVCNTTLPTYKLCGHKAYIDMYYSIL